MFAALTMVAVACVPAETPGSPGAPISTAAIPPGTRLIISRTAENDVSHQALMFSLTNVGGAVAFDANGWNALETWRPNGWQLVADYGANVFRAVDASGTTISTIDTTIFPTPLPQPGYWTAPTAVSPDGTRVLVMHEWFDLASNSTTVTRTQVFDMATGGAAAPEVAAFRPIWNQTSDAIAWSAGSQLMKQRVTAAAAPEVVTTINASQLCSSPSGWTAAGRIVVSCASTDAYTGVTNRVTWTIGADGIGARELNRSTASTDVGTLGGVARSLVFPGTNEIAVSIPETTTTAFGSFTGLSLFVITDTPGATPKRVTSPNPQLVGSTPFTWVDTAEAVYLVP